MAQPSVSAESSLAPLERSYGERFRPLLDAVDKLRHLKVMQQYLLEGIRLPTVVVVGDQSSGRSSIIETLAGVSLYHGRGSGTRVPLILRLQHHPHPEPQLHLEYSHGKILTTDEAHVAEDINLATIEIAGSGKGVSNTPLTLVVKKNNGIFPHLTLIDLPAANDISDELIIADTTMEYIKRQDSIILNVLAATIDITHSASTRILRRVEKSGERTLAVVTKADLALEGLLEKLVTVADEASTWGLGYVCVRNRIGDGSYEDARTEETKLFETHPQLSKIDKSMVGLPVLVRRLVQILAISIAKCLPKIITKIIDELNATVLELSKMPRNLSSVAEAITAFMWIIGSTKESLRKILLRGEFDEFPDDRNMHGTARMAEMLNQYAEELGEGSKEISNVTADTFLMEEISVLKEAKGIGLPNFLPRSAFLTLLQRKLHTISDTQIKFVEQVWKYIEDVLIAVITYHSEYYLQLQSYVRRAAKNLIAKMKEKSVDRVMEMIEMEKLTDYTCDPEYIFVWTTLMTNQHAFKDAVNSSELNTVSIEGVGVVNIGHLREYPPNIIDQAFDMKMRVTAYWKIVLKRLVDSIALHLLFSVQNLVNRDMEMEIVIEVMGPKGDGMERMLEESPSITRKREKLKKSIKLLKDSKELIGKIMDRELLDHESF